jgi:membrane dipeptidase
MQGKGTENTGIGQPVSRRHALAATAAALGGLFAAPALNVGRYRLFAYSSVEYSARCVKLLQESTVVDMLSPLTISDRWSEWARAPETFTEAVFRRYRDSGINVFHHSVGSGGPTAYELAINYFGATNALIAGADQFLMRLDSAGDFSRVKTSGKVAVMLGLQNSEHFRRPQDIPFFFGLGQRVSQLTYNGLDHPKRMFDLTEGLIRRKYSDAEIAGVLGGNFARVLGQIWAGQKTG